MDMEKKKGIYIALRITELSNNWIIKKAKKAGLTKSSFIRTLLENLQEIDK